ncbi:MAG: hypothetical protein QOJ39_1754, partial [Candidatus Eremiobacteraeota bacterium]|nr:hypothetical protein [Candidatus Eremiobacteraeota bacterium]
MILAALGGALLVLINPDPGTS